MKRIALTIALVAANNVAQADSFESMNLATNLGNLLASEEFCGLSYNAQAIELFIIEKVSEDDIGFASSLQLMTEGSKFQLQDLSAAGKIAHCTQTKRAAKSHGFIE